MDLRAVVAITLAALLAACGYDGAGPAAGARAGAMPTPDPDATAPPTPTGDPEVTVTVPGAPVGTLTAVPRPTATPLAFPCQSDLGSEVQEEGGAAYVAPAAAFLVGCVRDERGRPIRGAYQYSVPASPGAMITALGLPRTDRGGRYADLNVQVPGVYEVRVSAPGYESQTKRVTIKRGRTAVRDFVLER